MESRVKEVLNKKVSGKYNCAQAVACTYADIAHLDEETVYNTAAAFGAGMGCMEGTCGAIIGAGIVLGLKYKDKAQAMKAQKAWKQKRWFVNAMTVLLMRQNF